jgi:hypothetical protein
MGGGGRRILPGAQGHVPSTPMSNMLSQGAKKTELQFDSTAAFAAQRFSSVIESLVTPQGNIWHLLKLLDKTLKRNRQVRMFFDDLNRDAVQLSLSAGRELRRQQPAGLPRPWRVRQRRPLHRPAREDAGPALPQHPPRRGVLRREPRRRRRHALSVVPMSRARSCSSANWAIPESVREAAKNPRRWTRSARSSTASIRARTTTRRVDGPGKKFASVYIFIRDEGLLREWGYDSFPYAVTRYTQASGETYGRGPAQWVLPAIKVLNEQKKTVLKQGHRIVDPVLLAHDDGNLGNFSLRAGALNAGGMSKDGKRLIDVLPTGNLTVGDKMMDMEKAIITTPSSSRCSRSSSTRRR